MSQTLSQLFYVFVNGSWFRSWQIISSKVDSLLLYETIPWVSVSHEEIGLAPHEDTTK